MARARVHVDDLAFANRLHRQSQSIKAWNVRRECIAGYANDDEAQRERTQVILMFEFAVDGHEDIKPTLGKAQERVILTALPRQPDSVTVETECPGNAARTPA
jgi:hypothetical protein